MPSAYGDRRRLTPAIHEQYLRLFPDPDSRERVLFALAKSLLGSSVFFDRLWQRRDRLAGVPVHLLWGMRDSAFPSSFLERWQQALPHAHTTRIDAAGHWPHEEEPEAFVRALQACLDNRRRIGAHCDLPKARLTRVTGDPRWGASGIHR